MVNNGTNGICKGKKEGKAYIEKLRKEVNNPVVMNSTLGTAFALKPSFNGNLSILNKYLKNKCGKYMIGAAGLNETIIEDLKSSFSEKNWIYPKGKYFHFLNESDFKNTSPIDIKIILRETNKYLKSYPQAPSCKNRFGVHQLVKYNVEGSLKNRKSGRKLKITDALQIAGYGVEVTVNGKPFIIYCNWNGEDSACDTKNACSG